MRTMARKIFREVVSIKEAVDRLYRFYSPKPQVEKVLIENATGRICAEDIYAVSDVPPFDRATMDGFAVQAKDTFTADEDKPVRLKIIGEVEAGQKTEIRIVSGTAVEIATGAAMPAGADAVVMVEYTRNAGEYVEIFRPVSPGENIMAAGSDIMAGELILREGSEITHRDVGVLAACGVRSIAVYRKPVIAVISTGNELVEPGKELEYGKIYDVNSYALCSAIEENGGKAIFLGITKDCKNEIEEKIAEGLKTADIVITSGGTSAGVGDMIYDILDKFDPGVIVHGIAVKPGKPAVIALCNGKPVFGLPGYPTSALTVFEILVAPLIRKLAGIREIEREEIQAKLAVRTFSSEGRREFLPVNLVRGTWGYTAYPVSGLYSGSITALALTDGFIEIPENTVMLEEGEEVEVKLFSKLKPADLVIIGSHCIGVDLILKILRKRKPLIAKVINVGSTSGLLAIKRGEADIAGTHLLDESGEYNLPVMKKLGVRNVILVKGYLREQGFIVKKGNPKGIEGFEDLLRDDVKFINRNRGSGTRVLLDSALKELSDKKGISFEELKKMMSGYEIEAKTHTSVAVAVATGKVDVGVGIKTVAARYNLDFIPLRSEEYDFVIRKDRLSRDPVRNFLEILMSNEFAEELEKIEGLKVYGRTGEFIEL
jgi:putative molybdopterin biosynthesis protein